MNAKRREGKTSSSGNDDLRMDGLKQYMAEFGDVACKGNRMLEGWQLKRNGLQKILDTAVGDANKLRELHQRYKSELAQLEQRERDILSRKEKELKIISANKQKLEALHSNMAAEEKEFQERVSEFEKWSTGFLDQFMNLKLKSEHAGEVELVTELEVATLASQLKALEFESEMLEKNEGNEIEDLFKSLEELERSLDNLLKKLRRKVQEKKKEVEDLEGNASNFQVSSAPDSCSIAGSAI